MSDFVTIEVDEWFGDETLTYDVNGGVLNYNSPELIWGYGDKRISEILFQLPDIFTYPGSSPIFSVSDKFLAQHDVNDLRPACYYQRYFKSIFPMVFGSIYGSKSNLNDLSNPHRGMRVAEAYLNRAEANIRLFLENGNENLRISALTDLNYLREHRFRQPYEDVNITDGQTLLEFCLDERRKELAFDDHRWFDLRRYGMPSISHKYKAKKVDSWLMFTLKEKDPLYTIPFPTTMIMNNNRLEQNVSAYEPERKGI